MISDDLTPSIGRNCGGGGGLDEEAATYSCKASKKMRLITISLSPVIIVPTCLVHEDFSWEGGSGGEWGGEGGRGWLTVGWRLGKGLEKLEGQFGIITLN